MTKPEESMTYEPPVLRVLGEVHALTEGLPGGQFPDASLPAHPCNISPGCP
jgi:hypothetical protein